MGKIITHTARCTGNLRPGEIESQNQKQRLEHGIYIEHPTWAQLIELSNSLGVKAPTVVEDN